MTLARCQLLSRLPDDLKICIEALAPWQNTDLFSRGVSLGLVASRVVVTTDASTRNWGAVCEGMPASGLWSEPQNRWHINRLELEAVLDLKEFRTQLEQQHVLIRTDNTSVVLYINRQGSIRSRALCKQAMNLLIWADSRLLSIRATHIPGLPEPRGGHAFEKEDHQGEWGLHPESVRMIGFGTATGEQRWIYSPRVRMRTARCSSPCLTPRWKGTHSHRTSQQPAVCVFLRSRYCHWCHRTSLGSQT